MDKSDKSRDSLNIETIMNEFNEAEESAAHRKGTFKITAPFDKALDTIVKAKPEPKRQQRRRKANQSS